jgi:excisionase family DNA binding protein
MSIKLGDMALYDVEELSEMLGVGIPTIRKYLREGKLKGIKPAKRWYVSEEALKDYFQPEPEVQLEDAYNAKNMEELRSGLNE